jgi:hypothetical protein
VLLTSLQKALKERMWKTEPTQQTRMLKRRVGYGDYMDAEETEPMEVDGHVDKRQNIG